MKVSFDRSTGRLSPPAGPEHEDATPAYDVGGKVFTPPSLLGRGVYLRTLAVSDYEFLQAVETQGELAIRWRFAGGTPSPEQWLARTWAGVLAQYLVIDRRDNRPIGMVSCYESTFQHGHAQVAAARFDDQDRSAGVIVGFGIFLRYLFTCWPFRKLYMELPEYNLPQFGSGEGRFFEVEARLPEHYFYGGQYWDKLILTVERDNLLKQVERTLGPAC